MIKILRDETGSTSLLTSMFFILFLSVLAVSFMHIVSDERERSIQNEVSASALAAAQSGIEDGKRVIFYCVNNFDNRNTNGCANALNTDQSKCDSNNSVLRTFSDYNGVTKLIKTNEDDPNKGSVDSNSQYDEWYDCLFVDTLTENVEFNLADITTGGVSTIFPLHTTDTTKSMSVRWHIPSDDSAANGDGRAKINFSGVDENSPKNSWNSPAELHFEIAKVPRGEFTPTTIESRIVTLRPGPNGINNVKLQDFIPKDAPNANNPAIVNITCDANDASGYACGTTIDTAGFTDDPNYDYFVRLYTIYRGAHIKIDNLNGQKGIVKFDNVQPMIDVTGHSGTTRRRVITRVQLESNVASEDLFPEFAVESNNQVCKKMQIVDTYGVDQCFY